MVFKTDGYIAAGGTGRTLPLIAKLWVTDQTVTAGQWIASYAGDVTSPSGLAGGPQGSFRKADADNADAVYNTVGVVRTAVDNSASATAAGYVEVIIGGYADTMNIVSASVAANDDLIISTTSAAATVVGTPTANVRVIGQCLTDGGSNQGTGIIHLHPMFAGIV
tara:strand:- start:3048 stop:3542 length:495 start_codon:yes stop_codon:yes gene_type:complete